MGGIFLLQINTRKMHNLAQYFVSHVKYMEATKLVMYWDVT